MGACPVTGKKKTPRQSGVDHAVYPKRRSRNKPVSCLCFAGGRDIVMHTFQPSDDLINPTSPNDSAMTLIDRRVQLSDTPRQPPPRRPWRRWQIALIVVAA